MGEKNFLEIVRHDCKHYAIFRRNNNAQTVFALGFNMVAARRESAERYGDGAPYQQALAAFEAAHDSPVRSWQKVSRELYGERAPLPLPYAGPEPRYHEKRSERHDVVLPAFRTGFFL